LIPALSYGTNPVRQLRQNVEIQLVMMVKFPCFIEEIYREERLYLALSSKRRMIQRHNAVMCQQTNFINES
jgi:hypothetical protein